MRSIMNLAACVCLIGSAQPASASALSFALDLEIAESISDTAPAGVYRRAGEFRVNSSLLESEPGVPRTLSLISWNQVRSFSLDLPGIGLNDSHLTAGTCLAAGVLPSCGLLFTGSTYLGLVGQYSIPNALASPGYNLRLDNTSSSLLSPDAIFQSVSIEDLDLGFTVAGGSLSVRPIPEPSSVLALLFGAAVIGIACRKSSTQRPSPFLTRTAPRDDHPASEETATGRA